jgi:hypothetical protein
VWPYLLLAGLEQVTIAPGDTAWLSELRWSGMSQ